MKTDPTPSCSRRPTAAALAAVFLLVSFTHAQAADANSRPGDISSGHDPGRRGGPGAVAGTNTPADWAYVVVGPEPAFDTEGVQLLRGMTDDHAMSGGTMIHPADAGGGTGTDTWSPIIQIPFSIQIYGVPFDKFCVSKSGLLTFTLSVANTANFVSGTSGGWALPGLQDSTQTRDDDGRTGGELTSGDGTAYFGELDLVSGSTSDPLGLPHPDLPNNTIAYFWRPYLPFSAKHIYIFMYGTAPNRQAWIINAGHRKRAQGDTHTAVVLEERTNRIFVVDMSTSIQTANGYFTVGIQRNSASAHQIALSPKVPVTGQTSGAADNAVYILQPFRRHELVSGQAHANLAQLDAMISDWMEAFNLPGALVAATQGGRLVLNKAYGFANVETGLQMQPFHRGGIGSVSKVLTAMGVMRLLELAAGAGVPFSLEDHVYGSSGLLAAFGYEDNIINGIVKGLDDGLYAANSGPYWFTAYNSIRLRHLLTHTSGFRGGGDPDGAATLFDLTHEAVTYSHIHRHFLETKPLASPPPGTPLPVGPDGLLLFPPPQPIYDYSNHGFGLCGHIIAAVGGISYIDFMQAFIFGPLNIAATHSATHYSDLTSLDAKRYAYWVKGVPYHTSSFDGSRVYGSYSFKRGDLGTASGGWVISARELVRLLCATDQLANQPDILTPASLNEMESVPYPLISSTQAHGWGRFANGTLVKDGKNIFCAAYMGKYASGVNVAIIVNTGASSDEVEKKCHAIKEVVTNAGIPVLYDLFGVSEGGP
jgi:CubicO group peptidase (beta-lactamase class C family)